MVHWVPTIGVVAGRGGTLGPTVGVVAGRGGTLGPDSWGSSRPGSYIGFEVWESHRGVWTLARRFENPTGGFGLWVGGLEIQQGIFAHFLVVWASDPKCRRATLIHFFPEAFYLATSRPGWHIGTRQVG